MSEKMRKRRRRNLALLLSAAMLAAVPGSAVLGMELAEAESVYDEAETVIGAEVAEESPATIILDENEDFAEDDVEENANFGVAAADAGNDQIGADLKEQESGNTDSGVSVISIEEVPATASVQTDDSETMTVSTVDSGTCGNNLSWTLDSEGTLTISGSGEMDDYERSADDTGIFGTSPFYNYREDIKTVIVEDGVTSIGDFAFYECWLTEISISDSVTTIGEGAFYWCYFLEGIDIPDSVKSIGDEAFSDCNSISSLKIGAGLSEIDFAGSGISGSALQTITVSDDNGYFTAIDNVLFSKDETILYLFPWNISEYSVPDNVTTIGKHAFACCTLVSVVIPDNVTSIEEGAFFSCGMLEEITIPDGVESLGASLFMQCRSLAQITIPNSVKSIGEYVFYACDSLTDIYYTGSEQEWESITIDSSNVEYLANVTIHCDSTSIDSKSDQQVTASADAFTITVGSATQITASTTGDGALTYSSDNTSVATVSSSGLVTGVSAGTATITVTAAETNTYNSASKTVAITVTAAADSGSGTGTDDNDSSAVGQVGTSFSVDAVSYTVMESSVSGMAVTVTAPESKTITSVTIPATVTIDEKTYTVTAVADNAFADCTSLKTVTIDATVVSVGAGAFSGCTSLTTVNGMENVTTIGSKAFYNCKKLTTIGSKASTVTLASIQTIGKSAFYGCKAIKKVNLTSKALTSIGASAFQGCTALKNFTAKSAKLKSIGKKAFYGDKKLASVTLKTKKLKKSNVKTNAFKGIKSTCTFKVPSSKVSAYKKLFRARGASSKIKVKKA